MITRPCSMACASRTACSGRSDPYETPENAEMVIDTIDISPDLAAHRILVKLESMGFIR